MTTKRRRRSRGATNGHTPQAAGGAATATEAPPRNKGGRPRKEVTQALQAADRARAGAGAGAGAVAKGGAPPPAAANPPSTGLRVIAPAIAAETAPNLWSGIKFIEMVRTKRDGGALVGLAPRDCELIGLMTRPVSGAPSATDGAGNSDLLALIGRAAEAGYVLVIRTDLMPID